MLFINTCKYTFNFILRQRWYRSGAHQMPLAENWLWLKIHKVNPDHGINTFLFLFSLSHEISILFFYYFPFEFYSLYTWKTLGTALIANRDWLKINQKLKQLPDLIYLSQKIMSGTFINLFNCLIINFKCRINDRGINNENFKRIVFQTFKVLSCQHCEMTFSNTLKRRNHWQTVQKGTRALCGSSHPYLAHLLFHSNTTETQIWDQAEHWEDSLIECPNLTNLFL